MTREINNMTVLRNDKVILVKKYGKLELIGNMFEVANVTETAVILRDPKTKVAVGAIAIDDFANYFKKEFEGWTDWAVMKHVTGETIGYYRTNGKKVQVKTVAGNRSEATCCEADDFNLATGVNIAFYRCHLKELDKMRKMLSDEMTRLNEEYGMISSRIESLSK